MAAGEYMFVQEYFNTTVSGEDNIDPSFYAKSTVNKPLWFPIFIPNNFSLMKIIEIKPFSLYEFHVIVIDYTFEVKPTIFDYNEL